MPDNVYQMFSVNEVPWHKLGDILTDYPGRDEAYVRAGHNFTIVQETVDVRGVPLPGWKALVKEMPGDPSDGLTLHMAKSSYGVIPNEVGWDMVDLIVGQGAKYETAGTLEMGAECWVLVYLDEPIQIKGDDSPYLPFLNVNWRHNGTGALTGRSTSIRVVCANTQSASEAQGARLGTDFTFRHTKNWEAKVEDAKAAISGLRIHQDEFVALANELCKVKLTKVKVEDFVQGFIPMPLGADISDRVVDNIETARQAIRSVIAGQTVPDAHKQTGYGMWLAGVEYLDHIRDARSLETKFRRSIMRNEPAKTKLRKLILEVA